MYNPRYERSDDYRYQFIKAHPGAFGKFYMCPYCGRIMLRKTMQVDHIVSIHLANKHRAYRILVPNGNINSIHIFEDIPVFNGSDKVSYTITQDAVNGYTTEIKASDDGNTIEIINTHIPVVPPKEEPKKEEPATPAPVVEVKVEQPAPTVTLIQTTNKPTGISFFESLFAK